MRPGRPASFVQADGHRVQHELFRMNRSDTERGAVQDAFALATTLSKPKYNRLAFEFVSSS
jgi:hypothetical protein